MNNEAREARKLYMKQWREKNKEHCREYGKKYRSSEHGKEVINSYWERKAKEMKAKEDDQ